jgi:hypothetical protein
MEDIPNHVLPRGIAARDQRHVAVSVSAEGALSYVDTDPDKPCFAELVLKEGGGDTISSTKRWGATLMPQTPLNNVCVATATATTDGDTGSHLRHGRGA